jgi:hypothetical protein
VARALAALAPRLEGLEHKEETEGLTEAEKKKLEASRKKDDKLQVEKNLLLVLLTKEQKVEVLDGEHIPYPAKE